jgi:dienelactone hydrolase
MSQRGISIDAQSTNMVQATHPALSYAAKAKSLGLRQWQKRLQAKLLDLLAIDGKPRKRPPMRFVDHEQMDGYMRHRGYMTAEDGLDVPVYVLEPDEHPGKMPICVAAHGHGTGKVLPVGIALNDRARELIEGGERDYGVQAVRRGYLTISPDFRGFGELMLREDLNAKRGNSCPQLALRGMQLGRPLLGQRVSDVMQLLDWALARPDVDPSRVVITGNSGGGTMTLFSAAVDERFTACAPSCYFSTFAGSTLAMNHCPCNYVPNLSQVAEMSDLAGLVAPRPMLVIAGTQDTIFPIDAVREGFAAAQKPYADAKSPGNIELYEGAGGHRYYAARVWDFFAEKLSGSAQ